jgi:hypothetical protein
MTMTTVRRVALVATVAGAMASMSRAQEPTTTLAVAGRGNSAPWVATHGRTVAVTWAAGAGRASDIFVAISRDEGATFTAPVQVNRVAGEARVGGEIPPRVALHARPGRAAPDVVVAWNAVAAGTEVKVARSEDGGASFGAPQSLQAAGAPGDRGWHSLALDDHGVAHVLWLDHRRMAAAKGERQHQHQGEHDGVAMAQRSGLYYATFGARASADRQITPGVCYCCKSAVVALPGGLLLSAWRHVYPDNMRDIAFATSRDGGRSFAAPARVSADGWSINGCPDDGPALAAGANRRVHIVWPTVIPGDQPTGALFHASLGDDGRFAARTRIPTLGSPKPSHPQVALDATGRLYAAWDEILEGVRTAAFSSAQQSGDSLRFGAPERLAPGPGPSQYPVMAPLPQGVIAVWTSGAPGSSTIAVRRLPASPAESSRGR